ncbi:MAG: ABC transporter permease [Thermoplasmata archaeon]|nr:ABC transporter permease [Thermoplasmata archaeon]
MPYAYDALRRRPGRTTLTALGIGLATGLVVLLLALSAGVESSASRLAAASGVDLLATSANTSLSGGSFPPVTGAHQLPAAIGRVDPNVATASPWLLSDLLYANASLYAAANASDLPGGWSPTGASSVGWIPGDNAGLETPAVETGPGFSSASDPPSLDGTYPGPAPPEVVLDGGLATLLHVGVGSLLWASPRSVAGPSELLSWYANASAFRVVGISGPFWLIPSALLGFFYLSELQGMLGGADLESDYASLLLIHLSDPTHPDLDRSNLADHFHALSFFTLTNVLGTIQQTVDLYRTFGTLIGVIGLGVAVLFATTVLLMSVDDRSQEIALLRAIGFTRFRIGRLVLEEALLLSAFGLIIGLPVGVGGALAMNHFLMGLLSGLPAGFSFVSLDAGVIGSGVLEVAAVGLAASVLPMLRAVSLPVASELRAP